MTRLVRLACATALLLAGAALAGAQEWKTTGPMSRLPGQDWPKWLGPSGNGVTPETGWSPEALKPGAELAGKLSVGTGFGSVAIMGDFLYTVGNKGKEEILYCIDLADGKTKWQFSYPVPSGMDWPGAHGTPLVDGDRVYILGRAGRVSCLNAADGKPVWQKDLPSEIGARSPTWGFGSSPVVKGDVLYLNVCRAGAALNKLTGAKIWASAPEACGYASPVFYTAQGKDCGLFFGSSALYGVDLATGRELWNHYWRTGYDVNAADPLVIDGTKVFISSNYNRGCALLEVGGAKPVVLWENRTVCSHFSSFIYLNGYIYANDGDANSHQGGFRCLDAKTGKAAWSNDAGVGSLIRSGDKLILLNEKGRAAVIEADPKAYREISSFEFPRGMYWTAPVLCRGFLFVRSYNKGDIYRLDVRIK